MRTIFLLIFIPIAALVPAAAQEFEPSSEQEMVRLVNQERTKAGLPQLVVDERLTQVARQHSALMAEKRALSHQLGGELGVRQRIATTSLRFNYSGENVAFDAEIQHAHEELMNSPPHRENILRADYNAIGVGVVRKGTMIYVTEDFANRLPELTVDAAESRIDAAFSQLRRGAGVKPLPFIPRPELRQMACNMAANDHLSTQGMNRIPKVSHIVVYTATEIDKLPGNMQRLKEESASGYSLGACFSKSASYPNAVYWVVAVTYF